MIPCSPALKGHLSQPYQTMCTCWRVILANGDVLGFTDGSQDIDGNDIPEYVDPDTNEIAWAGGDLLYLASPSYTRSDIASNSDISVDNLDHVGMMENPAITENDLNSGLWDHAEIRVFAVNYEDLSMGCLPLREGWIGEVSLERNRYHAEMRGRMQAYSRTIVNLTGPLCRNTLGDAKCQVSLAPFTVTGTLTGVGPDNQTMYDSARAEAGPGDPVVIVSITNANPGVVTTATALGLPPYSPVQIANCTGMVEVNTSTSIRNPSGLTFELPVDTSAFGGYSGGGIVQPLGGATGYFDFGEMTFTSGANNGLKMEVRSYVPGSWVLMLPMPYAAAPGDTYSMVAGCDKTMPTCAEKFSNGLNNNAEWYLPGNDKILQVGKQVEAIA